MLPILAQSDFKPLSAAAQLTIVGLIFVLSLLVGIWAVFRRKPPVDVDLEAISGRLDGLEHRQKTIEESTPVDLVGLTAKFEALQTRQENFEKRHIAEMAALFDELKAVNRTISENAKTIERALGRIEGRQERDGERVH